MSIDREPDPGAGVPDEYMMKEADAQAGEVFDEHFDPGSPECPPGMQTYIVRRGDTMWLIARRFGVSLRALIAANPQIPDPNRIFPGQVVCIPPR